METKWLIFVLVFFVFSSLIMGVCEHVFLYDDLSVAQGSEEVSVLYRLTHFDVGSFAIPFVGEILAAVKWLGALLEAMFFNYSIMSGPLVVLKYILWMVSAAIVGRLILAWRGA